MITYEQIQKVNEGLTGIDVKGKNYIMVPQRVKAFRQLYPEGFINTKLLSLDGGVCVMQTEVGYYENGTPVVLGTGMAYEKETSSYINKTSYIENCETSAVGRALGFLGLGIEGGGICSAEELANALNNQKSKENEQAREANRQNNPNPVASVPQTDNGMAKAFESCMNDFMEMYGIPDSKEALKKFNSYREDLQAAKIVPAGKKMQTAEEVAQTFEAIYKNFRPSGEPA